MITVNEVARRRMRLGLAMLAVAACAEHATSPSTVGALGAPGAPVPSPMALARVTCTVDVRSAVVSCPASSVTGNVGAFAAASVFGGSGNEILLGLQDVVVRLGVSNPSYTGQVFSFDAAVTNLIPQSLGTADGETADPNGVRVFFAAAPIVTVGSGAIDFVDPATGALMVDGVATFTAPSQAFHRYAGMLGTSETSAAKRWRMHVPNTVTAFTFAIDVNAAVPRPFGWVDVAPGAPTLRAGQTAALTAVARNVVGAPILGDIPVWSTNAAGVATVNAATGVVTAASDGSATVTATSTVGPNTLRGDVIVTVQTASPATTTLSASPATLTAGATATITVQVKNAAGTTLNAGGDTVALTADSGTVSAVTDRGDGTYTAMLTSIVARGSRVTGTINGAALAASASVRFTAAGPVAIAKQRGDRQRASVGTPVLALPSVVLLDANGNLVADVDVTFAVVSGGGAVTGATTKTNASGEATVGGWTLGSTAGQNTLTATAGALTATFTATAEAGPLAIIDKLAGDGQSAVGGHGVSIAPSVRVTDASGNPVAGVAVTFTPGPGGRVEGGTQISGADGVATVGRWTLRTAVGLDTLTATAADVATTFMATAVSGPVASIAKTGGDGQTALVGTAVPTAPSVMVTDASGNPKAGATVTFAVVTGAGSVTGGMQITNASGVATAGAWTLGSVAGANTLTASTGSFATTFTATGVAGSASIMTKAAGDGQSAIVRTAVTTPPAVRITDANGNPVANISVTFSLASGGGSVGGATQATDASGLATAGNWTLGAITGANNNTLIATAGALNATFAASAVAGALHHFVVEAQNGGAVAPQVVGAPFNIRITAQDADGNTVVGFTGTVSLTSNGSPLTPGTSAAFTAGVLASQSVMLTQPGASFSITATNGGVGSETGTSPSFPVDPAPVHHFDVEAQGGGAIPAQTAGQSFNIKVTARDANDNVATGFTGTVNVTSSQTGVSGLAQSAAFTAGVLASHAVTLTQAGAGATITATRSSGGSQSGTSAGFVVSAATVGNIAAQAGDNQSATVNSAVAGAVKAVVRDAFNNPVPNANVTFLVTGGGGSATGTSQTTDASGIATLGGWTLGQTAGTNTLTATVGALTPATFTATGTAGAAASVAVQAGSAQSASVNTTAAIAPAAIVKDAFNNGVPGVSVTFAVTGGGGSVTGGSATTNVNGIATVGSWRLGATAGANTLSATVASLTPATFTATGTPAAAANIAVNSGDGQTATVNTAVATSPKVLVIDTEGNPKPGVLVTFTPSGNGTTSPASGVVPTDANGFATLPTWTLGTASGPQSLTATVISTSITTTFNATATPGAPASVAVNAGNNQSATVNTNVAGAVSAIVRDAFNNPVPNISATFAVTGGGGSITGASQTTNASGVATVGNWKLGTTTGTNTLTATVGVLTAATFTATGAAGAPTSIAMQAGNSQTTAVHTNVATAPSVLVKDVFNNLVPGATVTFAVASGGGAIVPANGIITTNAGGVATLTSWRLGDTAGPNSLSATVGALAPLTFTATGTAGAAANIVVNAGDAQTATVNTAVAVAPRVLMIDLFGNPKSGVSVTFTPTGNGTTSPANGVVTTDANGFAALTSWTLGTVAGQQTLTAQVTSTPAATVFTATATAGAPAQVSVSSGNNQSATANTMVSAAPAVIVRDAFNNPVPNVGVTFAVTGGGGTATGTSQTTNASGIATVGSWTLGAVAGTNALRATVGVLTPATFTATGQ